MTKSEAEKKYKDAWRDWIDLELHILNQPNASRYNKKLDKWAKAHRDMKIAMTRMQE